MTNAIKTETAALHFNPWPNAGPPAHTKPAPERAPGSWYMLGPLAAGTIGGAALVVLRKHPDRTGPGDRDWLGHRVREHLVALREAGDPAAKIAMAELESVRLQNTPLLNELVAKLLEAGSLLLTLRRDRAALDAAIERLANLAGSR